MHNTQSALTAEHDVVDKHDTVVHHDTNQHQHTQQRHYAHRCSGHIETDKHTGQGKRNREHDDERIGQRLELRCHDDEHKNDNQRHQHKEVGECILLILECTTKLPVEAGRHFYFIHHLVGSRNDITHRISVTHNAGNSDDTLTVLTLDCRRRLSLNHLSEVTNLHALSGRSVDGNVFNILNRLTELTVVADTDIIFVTVFTIVGRHVTVDTVTQISSGSRHVQSVESQFFTVEIHTVFRRILVTADIHFRTAFHFAHTFGNVGNQCVTLSEVVAIHFDVDSSLTAGTALTTAFQYLECTDFRIFGQILTHFITDFRQGTFTLC